MIKPPAGETKVRPPLQCREPRPLFEFPETWNVKTQEREKPEVGGGVEESDGIVDIRPLSNSRVRTEGRGRARLTTCSMRPDPTPDRWSV